MTGGERKKEETIKSEGCDPMSSIFEMMKKYCVDEEVFPACAAMLGRMGTMPCCGPDTDEPDLKQEKNEATE